MSAITAEGDFPDLWGYLSNAWDSVKAKTGGDFPEYHGPNPLWWSDVYTQTLAVVDNTAAIAQRGIGLIL